MTRTKSIIGAFVLCALALSAFGAATAAASGGLTAVECVEFPGGRFESSHCLTNGHEGNFETVAIHEGRSKEVEGTDTQPITETEHKLGKTTEPVAVFHSTVNAIPATVTCGTGNTTGGSVKNEAGMKATTTGAHVTWTECHASKETEPTKICEVEGISPKTAKGEIQTNTLEAVTGAEHSVKITPAGGTFTEFKIIGAPSPCFTTVNLTVKVTGKATGTADTKTHSHLTIKENWPCSTTEPPLCGELKANGNKAAQTETVTGFTKGNKEATVGATTESEITHEEA